MELIQAVEKALWDLSDLGDIGAIKNPLVTRSIESKLPESLKKEWLVYVADQSNGVTSDKRFDFLLAFLKQQESSSSSYAKRSQANQISQVGETTLKLSREVLEPRL